MRALLVIPLLLLVGCDDGTRLRPLEVAWSLESAEVDFGEVELGQAQQRHLRIVNLTRPALRATLELAAPFEAQRERVLAGGAATEWEVRFVPDQVGAFEQRAVITIDGQQQQAAIRGRGVQLISECQVDADCDSACLISPKCEAGRCVGAARSCDDGDACTTDVCVPFLGCQPRPVKCEQPPRETCEVARCDSVQGCVLEPAEDGAQCGESDCVTSKVCIQQSCVGRPTPEYASCGRTSPCQLPGKCVEQQCVQPPPKWEPVWTSTPEDAGVLLDLDAADPAGNLYGVSYRRYAGQELVSFDPSGKLRWRTVLPYGSLYRLSYGGGLVLLQVPTTREPGCHGFDLIAFRASDGIQLWKTDLSAAVAAIEPSHFCDLWGDFTIDRRGVIRLVLSSHTLFWNSAPAHARAWVATVSSSSGAVQLAPIDARRDPYTPSNSGPYVAAAADGRGVLAISYRGLFSNQVRANFVQWIDPDGGVVAMEADAGDVHAALPGIAYSDRDWTEVLSTVGASGQSLAVADAYASITGPRATAEDTYLLWAQKDGGVLLSRYATGGALRWMVPIPDAGTDAYRPGADDFELLGDTVLVFGNQGSNRLSPQRVHAFDLEGRERYRCDFDPGIYGRRVVVEGGRLFGWNYERDRLEAYDLDAAPAPFDAWTSDQGGPHRGRSPR